jgi:photosystem II stability/assembly factor-like uncharacterized protein
MKTIRILTFILILISGSIYSQQGWFWLNPLPQGNHLNAVSYVNSTIVYVSGHGGTLMKSTNGGLNFTIIPTGLRDNLNVTFINEITGFSPSGSGILRTTTAGLNWQYFHILNNFTVRQIHYVNNLNLFALLKSGTYVDSSAYIYKSTDLGISWNVCLNPGTDLINSFHFMNQFTGYAVGGSTQLAKSKIYKTTNGGNSWDSVASYLNADISGVYFFNLNTGFVTVNPIIHKILKTTNGCLTWDSVYNFNIHNIPSSIRFFNNNEGYAFKANDIIKTTNGGLNWQLINGLPVSSLVNINEGLGLDGPYLDNNIYKTINSGTNWTQVSQGFHYEMEDVFFINVNTGFAATYSSRILKTTDGGLNWLSKENFYLDVECIQFVDEYTGYAGLDWGRIAKTTNTGSNWEINITGFGDHNFGISFPSTDTGYSVTKYGYHLKTTNGGLSWISLISWGQGHATDVYFVNNNTGFSVGDTLWYSPGVIRRTTNGGENWTATYIDSIEYFTDAFASNDYTWFASGERSGYTNSYRGIILRSTNTGVSWASTYFPDVITAIHFPSLLVGYASSLNSIMYKTTNAGVTWFSTDCISANYMSGLYFVNNNTGYGVNYYGQIIKTTTGGGVPIGIQPLSNTIPEKFMLYQNYPNPFNPVTNIRFSIPAAQNNVSAKLVIYDILGGKLNYC